MITYCDCCKKEINLRPSDFNRSKLHFCNITCRKNYYIEKKEKKESKIRHRNECHNSFVVCKDYTKMIIISKKYGKKEVLIDTDKREKVEKIFWHLARMYNNYFVVVGWNKETKKEIKLHRYLTNCPSKEIVDHINRNPLDNRVQNLRCTGRSENSLNSNLNKLSKSGHKGITLRHRKNYSKYQVRIMINKKSISLGYFDNLDKAIKTRQEFCKKNNIIA